MSFAPEALPFVLPPAVAALVLLLLGRPGWAAVSAILTLALLLFFRIPRRDPAADPGLVLAAANGRVTRIDRIEEPALGPGAFQRVATFLSVFDVHVQRSPVAGEVLSSEHRPGRKLAAFRAAAGEVNESRLTLIRRPDGDVIGVRQIAGLLARRIVGYLEPGQPVARGQLLGLIKFGSRVDLLVPADYELLVGVGDRVTEGATPVARTPPAGSSRESTP